MNAHGYSKDSRLSIPVAAEEITAAKRKKISGQSQTANGREYQARMHAKLTRAYCAERSQVVQSQLVEVLVEVRADSSGPGL